ncbi:MAG: GNAT family N-acetyltransferase [Gammaproteobacteria bacterium]|nr:GNAT family N-acetyltransferase [Gammaproteobacteria bacterium]
MSYDVVDADLQADRQTLLDFWKAHHATPLDRKFSWIYQANPYGSARVVLLIHRQTERCVGTTALFPRTVYLGDRPLNAAVVGDLLLAPEHRTLGPAIMLQKAAVARVGEGGFDLAYTFPNKAAEPVIKRAGYTRVGTIHRFVRVLRSEPILRRRGWPGPLAAGAGAVADLGLRLVQPRQRDPARDGFRVEPLHEFGAEFEIVWRARRTTFGVTPDHSGVYMDWKFFHDPDARHEALALRYAETDALRACAVYTWEHDSIAVRDLVPGPDPMTCKSLVRALYRFARLNRATSLLMQCLDGSPLADELRRCGFSRARPDRNAYVHVASGIGADARTIIDPAQWLLMKSDEDT